MSQENAKRRYHLDLNRERNYWNSVEKHFFSKDPEAYLPKQIIEYMNETFTDSKDTPWWKFLKKFGTFQKGLSLGCGIGFIEKKIMAEGITQEMDLIDISEGAIQEARTNLQEYRCTFYSEDINHIDLPENKYDFILANSSLHHFVNLEHIVEQMEKTLQADGLLVIYDYIGEKKLQWDDARLDFVSRLIRVIPVRYRLNLSLLLDPSIPLRRRPGLIIDQLKARMKRVSLEEISPFEAVRSDETLSIVSNHFSPVHLRTMNFMFVLMMTNNIQLLNIKDSSVLDFLCKIDRAFSESTLFNDLLAFGVYRKKRSCHNSTQSWLTMPSS